MPLLSIGSLLADTENAGDASEALGGDAQPLEALLKEPTEQDAEVVSRIKTEGARPGLTWPDTLSGHLPAWTRARTSTANGRTTQKLRFAHAAFYAQATQTAGYKYENDDATFVER